MAAQQRIGVAKPEARMRQRRSDRAQPERIAREAVGAEDCFAGHPRPAIDLGQAGAHLAGAAHGGGACRGGHGYAAGKERLDRIDDPHVAGAAAEHPAQAVEHLLARHRARQGGQSGRGHQHAGRADAALGGARRDEGLLQPGHARVGGEALDRRDRPAVRLPERHQATADLPALEQHGAGTAVAGVAADLGTGQAEVGAQHFRQPARGRRMHPMVDAVDPQHAFDRRGHGASSSARAASASCTSARAPAIR